MKRALFKHLIGTTDHQGSSGDPSTPITETPSTPVSEDHEPHLAAVSVWGRLERMIFRKQLQSCNESQLWAARCSTTWEDLRCGYKILKWLGKVLPRYRINRSINTEISMKSLRTSSWLKSFRLFFKYFRYKRVSYMEPGFFEESSRSYSGTLRNRTGALRSIPRRFYVYHFRRMFVFLLFSFCVTVYDSLLMQRIIVSVVESGIFKRLLINWLRWFFFCSYECVVTFWSLKRTTREYIERWGFRLFVKVSEQHSKKLWHVMYASY